MYEYAELPGPHLEECWMFSMFSLTMFNLNSMFEFKCFESLLSLSACMQLGIHYVQKKKKKVANFLIPCSQIW